MLRAPLFIILLLIAESIEASTVFQVRSGDPLRKYPLLQHTLFYKDPTRTLTPQQFMERRLESQMEVPLGEGVYHLSESAYWIAFSIENISAETLGYSMVSAESDTDSIELFEKQGDQLISLGRRGDRIEPHHNTFRHPLFDLKITPGLHSYVIRMQSDGVKDLRYYLWTPELFVDEVLGRDNIILGVLFGFVLVMIAYNIFLAIRLQNHSYFLYVAYIACFGMVQFIFTGTAQYMLPPSGGLYLFLNHGLLIFAELTAIFGALFATHFLDLRRRSPGFIKALNVFYALSFIDIGLAIFSFPLSTKFVFISNGYVSFLLLFAGIKGCLQRYRPAYFYTAAWSFLILGNMITMNRLMGELPDNFFTTWAQFIGGGIEVILLSLALGDKMSLQQEQAHTEISRLNSDLKAHIENVESLVEEKTRDIRSIMEHIPLGIFMITTDHRIHRDHSRYLQEIFKADDLAKSHVTDFIFEHTTFDSNQRSQAQACLSATLGEDRINFEFNSESLPAELVRDEEDGRRKVFDLTWNPIENAQALVDKVLVTVRDVTELRQLQARSQDQQEELEFIGEIINISAPRFLRFIQSCHAVLYENKKLLHSRGIDQHNLEILKLLFINIHTIKGAARSLYLKKMAHIFHEVEQYYAYLQKDKEARWDKQRMLEGLKEAERIIGVYEKIARDKLGRTLDHESSVEIGVDELQQLYLDLSRSLKQKDLPDPVVLSINNLRELFFRKIFREVTRVFDDLFACLPLLAKDLHKEIPLTVVHAPGILLSHRAEELFHNIFVHILRNSMDHGIESAEIRLGKNKGTKGNIRIEMQSDEKTMFLRYSDDGQGLQIRKIREIGIARQLLKSGNQDNLEAIADLVFDSGLSTANTLTEISGRGVGMNAIREFIEKCGGRIRINLGDQPNRQAEALPFCLEMELPLHLFEHLEKLPEQQAA